MSKNTNTEQMTVHKALSELKIIGGRIDNAIEETTFIVANRHSNSKIHGVEIKEFVKSMKSKHQSTEDLIKRRDALKRAVVSSNAITKVTVAGSEFTVAEAIEMKNTGISYKKDLVSSMREQYDDAINQCARENEMLARKADEYIMGIYQSKDITKMSEDMQKARNEYITQNTYELVESIKVLEEIESLDEKIASFTSEVDSVLSVSNALTTITFSY
ncbi:MAG: hypothetical protein LBD23_11375 [Oscillospiraceae bacterium]|jgi:hypothetical protein|nr:hypothetical protein [Oscillospiraceae bacterium]